MEENTRRLFTAEARTAARPLNAGRAEERFADGFGIFVVATSDPPIGYRWELRKRDGSVLERSIDTFRTIMLARYAGLQALAGD